MNHTAGMGWRALFLLSGTLYTSACVIRVGSTGLDGGPDGGGMVGDSLETVITAGPSSGTSETTASFTFTGSGAVASFECALDAEAFAGCTSPAARNGLTAGAHVFQVRALDAAGTAETTPAQWQWTIIAPSLDTVITQAPSGQLTATNATFVFSGSGPLTGFECQLDAWRCQKSRTLYPADRTE
ncbi:MAG: hypothetical protein HY935_06310 [Nitrosomonadales bacterium]|nr:hypothetical protein [Nitrosomonadales bacterium]